jgi:sulfite oxidase
MKTKMLTANEPEPDLIVRARSPYNAETPLSRLRAALVTPQPDFFVRSHGNIPRLDGATHRLRVDGLVSTPLDLSMPELRQRFPEHTVTAVMQCAGNRRADLQSVRPTLGNPWAPGAIGNARWTGVRLADVLCAAGAENGAAMHVVFDSCDEVDDPDEGRSTYGASIPMAKALTPDVLLAFAMNGEPLTPEHGFPLRVVVPGFAGVRSPKWLAAITVRDRPSDNHMQARDYKLLPPEVVAKEMIDWDRGVTINELPINAAICEPARGAALKAGPNTLRGYAIASARDVTRVEVSSDGGCHWTQAELEHDANTPWSWTFWTVTLDLPKGQHQLVVRAWDSASQTQPALPSDTWNIMGYVSAAWHRVHVSVG